VGLFLTLVMVARIVAYLPTPQEDPRPQRKTTVTPETGDAKAGDSEPDRAA
jgi:hypothetical protein